MRRFNRRLISSRKNRLNKGTSARRSRRSGQRGPCRGERLDFGHWAESRLWLSRISDHIGHTITIKRSLADDLPLRLTRDNGQSLKVELLQLDGARRVGGIHLIEPGAKPVKLARYSYHITKPDRAEILLRSPDGPEGMLANVRASAGACFDYLYDPHGRILRWNDTATTWATYIWDDAGRCIGTRCAGGYWADRFQYDPAHRTTVYEDAADARSTFRFDDRDLLIEETDGTGAI